jgi:hypothetical protein
MRGEWPADRHEQPSRIGAVTAAVRVAVIGRGDWGILMGSKPSGNPDRSGRASLCWMLDSRRVTLRRIATALKSTAALTALGKETLLSRKRTTAQTDRESSPRLADAAPPMSSLYSLDLRDARATQSTSQRC